MKYLKRLPLIMIIAAVLEIGLFNFSELKIIFNSELKTNQTYTLADFQKINWTELGQGYVSAVDPILILSDTNMFVENIKIEVKANKEIPYLVLFYTNDTMADFSTEAMITQEIPFKSETQIKVGEVVKDLRIDLGDEEGIELDDITVTLNFVELNFSISRFIAMIMIYFGAVFLFKLQDSADYELDVNN